MSQVTAPGSERQIVYVGPFDFPQRNAAAQLACTMTKVFVECGYQVTVVGRQKGDVDLAANTTDDVGVRLIGTRSHLAFGLRAIRLCSDELRSMSKVRILIAYNPNSVLLIGLLVLSRILGITFIAHLTEWYSNPPWRGGVLRSAGKRLDTFLRMRILSRMAHGLILSSSYLSKVYSTKQCLVIPTLSDLTQLRPPETSGSEPTIVYAGIPFERGKLARPEQMKDRLDTVMIYFAELARAGVAFKFDIFGLTEVDFRRALPESGTCLRDLASRVTFHGYICSSEVHHRLRQADFTVLIRDDNRVTRAGFPTKITESINAGTPVLLSAPGDAEMYVVHGQTGFLLGSDPDAAVRTLAAALTLDPTDRAVLKANCRADTRLRASTWTPQVDAFLSKIVANPRSRT